MDLSVVIRAEARPTPFATLVHGSWLDSLVYALGVFALFATPLQMLRLATDLAEPLRLGIASAFAISSAYMIWRHALRISDLILAALRMVASMRLWQIAVVGVLLRLAWIMLFPAQPGSDGGTYLALARQLRDGAPYETDGTFAYWPVGYPLFLTGWLKLLPWLPLNYLVSNVFVFVVGLAGVAHLGNMLAGRSAGKFAALIFALWPNLVFLSATPEKELLVVALLPWATALVLASLKEGRGGLWPTLVAGVLLGAATLVQPSLQFLPLVGGVLLIGLSASWRAGLSKALLLLAGAVIVIAPWTIRNYEVFDRFVLVATNGGDNFYRANNRLATGGYTPTGERDLSALGEIERDLMGRKLALEWIRANPADFSALMVEKQIRFMGDDAVGVYTTLKVGKASDDGRVYALLKGAANGWWMLAWAALAAVTVLNRRLGTALPPLGRAPIWLWLYLFTLHSVFESAGKYHVPVLWVPCVLLAVYVNTLKEARR